MRRSVPIDALLPPPAASGALRAGIVAAPALRPFSPARSKGTEGAATVSVQAAGAALAPAEGARTLHAPSGVGVVDVVLARASESGALALVGALLCCASVLLRRRLNRRTPSGQAPNAPETRPAEARSAAA